MGAFLEAGHAACGFDSNRLQGVTNVDGPTSEDITTATGFRNAVNLVLRIRVGGLATFAPMCGSFNWLCAAQAKRAADNGWLGEAAHPFVAQGNAAAMATAFLARVAVLRGVQASVENPPRSYMWNMFSHHRVLLDLPHSCRTLRCGFRASGSTEDEITKEYKFACTHPWVVSLARGCTCPPSVAHITMTKKKDGKSWGIPIVMKRSQAYPHLLGAAVVAAWARPAAPLEHSPDRPALLALGDSAASVALHEPVQPAWARPALRRVRRGRGGQLVRTEQKRQRHGEGRRRGPSADSWAVLLDEGESELALGGDSESEPDLFGGGGISADVSDGRAADVVDDDSETALFSE